MAVHVYGRPRVISETAELFALLNQMNYRGWTLSESPATTDTVRVMRYYKALWDELTRRNG